MTLAAELSLQTPCRPAHAAMPIGLGGDFPLQANRIFPSAALLLKLVCHESGAPSSFMACASMAVAER